MWTSVGLTLLVGVCLGVVADRLVFRQNLALASPAPDTRPMWFVCSDLMLDAEDQPGYHYPEKSRKELLGGLSVELDLTPEQQDELETMLESRREGARGFWENMRHAYCDRRDVFRSDIRGLLEDDQQRKFDSMIDGIDRGAEKWVTERASHRR